MTKRLSCNINDECADSLEAYSRAHGITVTECIRRAISLLNYSDVLQADGKNIATLNAAGEIENIWKLL